MKKYLKGLLLFVMLISGNTHAALIHITLKGKVDFINDSGPAVSNIHQGDSAAYSFKFDTSSNSFDSSLSGTTSYINKVYFDGLKGFTGNVGGFSFSGNSGSVGSLWYKDSSYGIEYYQFNIDNNDGVYIPQEGGGYNLRHDFNSNPNLGGLPLRNFSILNFNDIKLIGIENITDALKNGNGLFFQLLAYDDSMNANVFIGGTFDTF